MQVPQTVLIYKLQATAYK